MNAPRIDVHLGPGDLDAVRRADLRAGLTASPKDLPSKWRYDARGSELFDRLIRRHEYYATEAERSILAANAADIVAWARPETIVELCSGTVDGSRPLLDAAAEAGTLGRFVPFDLNASLLRDMATSVAERHPDLEVHGVVGDLDRHLDQIPDGGSRLVMLLGGTIGNYQPLERKDLLNDIVAGLAPGDHLLLATDLIKDVARLEVAHDDPEGNSAAFAKNVIHVVNRELGADIDPDNFEYVARWHAEHEWIEMGLRSRWAQTAHVAELGLDVSFERGEVVRTEVATKFDPDALTAELAAVGLSVVEWYHDERRDVGVSLSVAR